MFRQQQQRSKVKTTTTIDESRMGELGGSILFYSLHAAELDAIVAGIAVLAMKLLIPHTNIGSIKSIAELDMADATLEAVDVIKQ